MITQTVLVVLGTLLIYKLYLVIDLCILWPYFKIDFEEKLKFDDLDYMTNQHVAKFAADTYIRNQHCIFLLEKLIDKFISFCTIDISHLNMVRALEASVFNDIVFHLLRYCLPIYLTGQVFSKFHLVFAIALTYVPHILHIKHPYWYIKRTITGLPFWFLYAYLFFVHDLPFYQVAMIVLCVHIFTSVWEYTSYRVYDFGNIIHCFLDQD